MFLRDFFGRQSMIPRLVFSKRTYTTCVSATFDWPRGGGFLAGPVPKMERSRQAMCGAAYPRSGVHRENEYPRLKRKRGVQIAVRATRSSHARNAHSFFSSKLPGPIRWLRAIPFRERLDRQLYHRTRPAAENLVVSDDPNEATS